MRTATDSEKLTAALQNTTGVCSFAELVLPMDITDFQLSFTTRGAREAVPLLALAQTGGYSKG